MKKPIIYLIGSLRNLEIPHIANQLRDAGFEVYADWWSASEDADDWWQNHERIKGNDYKQALESHHAYDVFSTDKKHLDRADIAVLVMPAGRSGHIELGYFIGTGKPGYVLFDQEPERFDLMYRFCKEVCFSINELINSLKGANVPRTGGEDSKSLRESSILSASASIFYVDDSTNMDQVAEGLLKLYNEENNG